MDTNMSLQTTTETTIARFDYNSIDSETATFLKERAKRILDIRMRSILSIGKELADAQAKLASHNKYEGVFTKWIESMGFKKSTAYNYIQAHGYVVQNLDNINDPEKLQPSLLLAISKPSAPAELQELALSGDIKTHKEYQELLSKYNEALKEKQLETEMRHGLESNLRTTDQALRDTQSELKTVQDELQKKINEKNSEILSLSEKLTEAINDGDSEKVKALEKLISEFEQNIDTLNNEITEMKNRPIDVAVKEVVPQSILDEIESLRKSSPFYEDYNYVMSVLKGFANLTTTEIKNWANLLNENPDNYDYYIGSADSTLEILKEHLNLNKIKA